MKLGLQIPSFTWPGGAEQIAPTLVRIGQSAEEAGFASLWVMDHFFQIEMIGKPDEPMLEGYNALNFLASVTRRIRLRHSRYRRNLPLPWYSHQNRDDPRCPLGRPRLFRHWCRLVRT